MKRAPPCHGHEHDAAYVRAIVDLGATMKMWLGRYPNAVLTWHEPAHMAATLATAGVVEKLAASPDAERMLREVNAARGGTATLLMARIALGLVGQLPHLDELN